MTLSLMRTWKLVLLTLTIAVAAGTPATASAAFQHVVASGESLSSVAAADGLSVSQLAAANGMSPDAQLVAGSSLAIPPQGVTRPPRPLDAPPMTAPSPRPAPAAATSSSPATP